MKNESLLDIKETRNLPNGWYKCRTHSMNGTTLTITVFHHDDVTESYDEADLRQMITSFLSNNSRRRYAPEKFSNDSDYWKDLQHLMTVLEMFFE